eukprot:1160256-Pelagomonas_calceolata.AAC.22
MAASSTTCLPMVVPSKAKHTTRHAHEVTQCIPGACLAHHPVTAPVLSGVQMRLQSIKIRYPVTNRYAVVCVWQPSNLEQKTEVSGEQKAN